ncbi:MAG: outer membrane protein assembly factor BamD, partial [Calditrichaeota bacterium]
SISILEKIKEGDLISPASTEEDLVNDALELTFFIEQALPDSNGALKLYATARKLLAQKKRQEAVQMFEKVARQFPASPVAPKAYLEAANLYRTLQKPEKEIQAYQNILQNYQNSIYTDVAMYQLALAYEKSGRIVEAVDTYEKFLVDFPQSIYLEEARQRLRALREHANQI